MNIELINRLIKIYRASLILLGVAFLVSIAAAIVEYTLVQPGSGAPPNLSEALTGSGIFSPSASLIAELIALPGVLWFYLRAKKLLTLKGKEQEVSYLVIRRWQSILGTIATAGAVLMIPVSFLALQTGLSGVAIVFPVFAGAIIHLRTNAVDREINSVNGENSAVKADPDSTVPLRVAGRVPLVVSAVVLAINVSSEISLFFSKWDSSVNDDSSIAFEEGFSQVFDILVLSLVAIALLVYAIITRKNLRPGYLRLISIFTIAGLLIFPGVITNFLVDTFGRSPRVQASIVNAQLSSQTLSAISELPLPAGFDIAEDGFSDCTTNCSDPDSSWRATLANLDTSEAAPTCEAVLNYAVSLGADSWQTEYQEKTGSTENTEEAIAACVKSVEDYPKLKVQRLEVFSPNFYFTGTANIEPNSPFRIELMLMKYGSEWENPYSFAYQMVVTTLYEDERLTWGKLAAETIEINELLTLVGQERLSNPDRNPTDPAFMSEIVSSYKYPLDIEIVETEPGVANRLHFTTSDGVELCLSVDPWDANQQGMEDPGTGYGLGYAGSLEDLSGFGNAVQGYCK